MLRLTVAAVVTLLVRTHATEQGAAKDPSGTPGRNMTPPTTTGVVLTAALKVGVVTNKEGDLATLMSSLLFNSLIWLGCVLVFSFLRLKFPMVYSNNVLTKKVPFRLVPSKRLWGWAVASFRMETSDVLERCGLDAAMFLEFIHLCMRVLAIVGVPLMILVAPLRKASGLQKPEEDDIGRIEMAEVEEEKLWLHYLVACLVWLVVLVTRRSVFNAQARFLKLRFKWLQGLPRPRATTILLEQIPEEYQRDTELRQYFEDMFGPGSVQSAVVVKRNSALLDLTTRWETVKDKLHAAKMHLQKEGATPRKMIRSVGPRLGKSVAAIPYYEEELRMLAPTIQRARKSLWQAAEEQGGGGVNTSNGFVTFTRRREAEMAHDLRYSANRDEWKISVAPDPESVRWKDLRHVSKTALQLRELLGYCCIVGLMSGYLVIVTTITNIARLIDFSDLDMPDQQPLWEAFAPTLGLQLLVSFLPTILLLIFRNFFILKDDTWAQHKLQIWYFWIQVVYVILVACIGQSLPNRMRQLMESPLSIVSVLAEELPRTTHFYMNYMLLQLATHATNILRIANLVKFLLLRAVYPEEEARRMSEPEDQDYFGIGSRSARFTIHMLIGIVFSTISPLIALLAFLNFALCRLQYGYLIMFAEARKPDLGGVFWVTQLEHVQLGVMIYCCLMIGMLSQDISAGIGHIAPRVIAVLALLFAVWSYRRFQQLFEWVRIPLNQIDPEDGDQEAEIWHSEAYLQPELQEDPELRYYGGKRDGSFCESNSEGDSIVLGIVKVLSSGAEVAARQVGELIMEVGCTIDQTLLGAECSEAQFSPTSTRAPSSPTRQFSPSSSPPRVSAADGAQHSPRLETSGCCAALPLVPPDLPSPVATGQEPSEHRGALPPAPPRMPSPPRTPSSPRSFADESCRDDWWLIAQGASHDSPRLAEDDGRLTTASLST